MKRDLNLFREILLKCEESRSQWIDFKYYWSNLHDHSDPELKVTSDWAEAELHHLDLLKDAGFVAVREKFDVESLGYEAGYEFRLTNSGHDYLDAVRDTGIWEKTKQTVAETGGSVSLEVVKTLAVGLARKKISEHIGITL